MSDLPSRGRHIAAPLAALVSALVAAWPAVAALSPVDDPAEVAEGGSHLVISELQTGGAGASDEFVELYNPTGTALPLEGLELVYVTASGSTVTRKAAWALGAPALEPGHHLLMANEAGIHAPIADLTYASGVAATGGAWALRIQGAATAVDAVGWGAATAWLETRPAPAPAAGSSLERLPGGSFGSTQDVDDNLVDFAVRDMPEPQNLGSPPVPDGDPTLTPTPAETPSSDPTPIPTAIPTPTPTPTLTPTPTPSPTPIEPAITIAEARALPEGATVTIRGTSLTDGAFSEGGGYLADATGGIAILLDDGTFPRGQELTISGSLDDRYEQRTLRGALAGLTIIGPGVDPAPMGMTTGAIGEGVEGQLVAIEGLVAGSATSLSGGLAIDFDDGSGPVRVFVGTATSIDIGAWETGSKVSLQGVVGQRDSSGIGTTGYRVQPRDAADILAVEAPPTPTPVPTLSPTPTPDDSGTPVPSTSLSPSPQVPLLSIADARTAETGTQLRIRGVVTVASGMVEPGSAVVQDGSDAILVRLGDDAGTLARGELVELAGTRSTKSGMLSLRVSDPPLRLGQQAEPGAIRVGTGAAGEAHEARLVVIRGAVTGRTSRLSGGGVSFEVDDGSGPLRVAYSARAALGDAPAIGTWIEVVGALGQETTGQQPLRGYRVWPRDAGDIAIIAPAAATTSSGTGSTDDGADLGPLGGSPGRNGVAPGLGASGDGSPAASDGISPAMGRGGSTDLTSTPGGLASSGQGPTASSPRRSVGAGVLLVGLAGLLAAGVAAWRTGLVARLRRPSPASEDGHDAPDGEVRGIDELPLTRLSVVRGTGSEPT